MHLKTSFAIFGQLLLLWCFISVSCLPDLVIPLFCQSYFLSHASGFILKIAHPCLLFQIDILLSTPAPPTRAHMFRIVHTDLGFIYYL